ncbi:MAG: RNA polymerase sigma factor [Anaerolineae bacterium]|nr:RNA polymerase sigma factor [Anaerolineae bacterium]
MMVQYDERSSSVQEEDGSLVARVRNGDIDALGELYERHHSQVYRTATAITHDERMAEDILQEVFLRVNRYADSFDQTQPFEPWLYRITVNLCYTWTNRAKRWVYTVQDTIERLRAPSRRDPEKVTESREQRALLRRAIDSLPDSHRVVVVLYYLEGLSVNEVAYALGVPEGTVKSRLYYAREKLRKAVTEQEVGVLSEVVYDFT